MSYADISVLQVFTVDKSSMQHLTGDLLYDNTCVELTQSISATSF